MEDKASHADDYEKFKHESPLAKGKQVDKPDF